MAAAPAMAPARMRLAGQEREEAILSLAPRIKFIIDRYRRLYWKRPEYIEELEAQAWLGAIRAVDRFDPARGVPLRLFAERFIQGHVIDWQRSWHGQRKGPDGQYPLEIRHVGLEEAGRPVRMEDDFPGRIAARETVARLFAITNLSGRERHVLGARFYEGRSHRSVAAELGLTLHGVWAIQRRALAKLRDAFDQPRL